MCARTGTSLSTHCLADGDQFADQHGTTSVTSNEEGLLHTRDTSLVDQELHRLSVPLEVRLHSACQLETSENGRQGKVHELATSACPTS